MSARFVAGNGVMIWFTSATEDAPLAARYQTVLLPHLLLSHSLLPAHHPIRHLHTFLRRAQSLAQEATRSAHARTHICTQITFKIHLLCIRSGRCAWQRGRA
jgi:hypothetical protein